MEIYLGGPMRGYPNFNRDTFALAATFLRSLGHSVFSPAENDVRKYGAAIHDNPTGSLENFKAQGGSHREVFFEDCQYICLKAEAIALLPGWENSLGANAEWALSKALGHRFMYLNLVDGKWIIT